MNTERHDPTLCPVCGQSIFAAITKDGTDTFRHVERSRVDCARESKPFPKIGEDNNNANR